MRSHGETADNPLRKGGRFKVMFGFARAITRPPLRYHPTSGNFMMSMAQDRESWIEAFRQMQTHTATGPLQISLVDVDADTITLHAHYQRVTAADGTFARRREHGAG